MFCFLVRHKKSFEEPYALESVSKSPKSGRVHCIPHKWEQKFNGTPSRCIGCTRPIKVFSTCQRCGVCK